MTALIVVAATGCASNDGLAASANDTSMASLATADVDPPTPEAQGAAFILSPANPKPGATFTASFDPENSRGGYFLLSLWNGASWMEPMFFLESDANSDGDTRDVPNAIRIDVGTDYGTDDYGVEGAGPDGLVMPSEMPGGYWRLCTANASNEVCAQFVVEP